MKTPENIEWLASNAQESHFADTLQPDTVLANQYKIVSLLKSDSYASSYLCEELTTGTNVVIYAIPDFLNSNGDLQKKLEHLLNDLALLKSKSIFTKYQLVNLSPQKVLIAAKYPTGKNISQWRESHDIGSEEKRMLLKHLLLDAASALDYLHSRGMIHGCVIPENMLVTNDNSLILINTGIVPLLKQQEGKHQVQLGNRDCLDCQAPELWNGDEANSKSEQYALATITYELISGTKPFDWVARGDLLKKVMSTQMPDPPSNATKMESSAIMKALDRQPQKRFSSCKRFVKALTPFKPSPLQIKISITTAAAILIVVLAVPITKAINNHIENARIARLEAEAKAEEERQEAEAKAEKQRQEAEIEKRSNEAGQLQWKANVALQEILSLNTDVGQTFGEHIRTAQEKYSQGETAINSDQRAEAYGFFAESIENSNWVRNNIEIRNSLKQTVQRILALQAEKEADSNKLFPERWKTVTDKCSEAVAAYEAGDFLHAENLFQEVETDLLNLDKDVHAFMKKQYVEVADKALADKNWELAYEYGARIESIDRELGKQYIEHATNGKNHETIDSELVLAKKSEELTKWEDVILHCAKILELDDKNEEAKKLHEEAVLATTCNLQAKTKINGDNAECSIEINNELISGTTNELIKNLPYGTSIIIRFVSIRDNTQYEWSGSVDCNWKGVQTNEFNLEKSIDLLLEAANSALEEKKWDDLLHLTNKLLILEPESEIALQMKETAELELSCNVDIVPVIEGSVVKAEYSFNSQKHYTGKTLRNLEFNHEYIIELRAEENGIQFEGVCQFTADWHGVKQITVTMQKTRDVLLQRAQDALSKKEWQLAYDEANELLSLLPGDTDATRVRNVAELQMTSNLRLKAILDGKEVEAIISSKDIDTSVTTPTIIRMLEKGQKLNYVLSYSSGGKLYKGQYEGVCDWVGIKEVEIVLKDEFKRLSSRATALEKEEKWDELLLVAKEMLVLDEESKVAKRFLEHAENSTTKCLQIQPILNSNPVVGDIYQCEISGTSIKINKIGKTSTLLKKLPVSEQTFNVMFLDKGEYYWERIVLKETWKGIKTVQVDLKKLDPTSISLGSGITMLRMERLYTVDEKFYWSSKSEITEEQYKAVMSKDDLYTYTDTVSTSFTGKPVIKQVKKINWRGVDLFCKTLTVKCIKEGVIPPGFEFATLDHNLPENSKNLHILLVRSKGFR